jgi:hypothetical protein
MIGSWCGLARQKSDGAPKIFIAEKQETSYYRFCGYGNYENTHLFVRQAFRMPSARRLERVRVRRDPAKSTGYRPHSGLS